MDHALALHIANLIFETGEKHGIDYSHLFWRHDPFFFSKEKMTIDALISYEKGDDNIPDRWWILRFDLSQELPLASLGYKVGKEEHFPELARGYQLRSSIQTWALTHTWPEGQNNKLTQIIEFLDDLAQKK